jgi:hypothetical protein
MLGAPRHLEVLPFLPLRPARSPGQRDHTTGSRHLHSGTQQPHTDLPAGPPLHVTARRGVTQARLQQTARYTGISRRSAERFPTATTRLCHLGAWFGAVDEDHEVSPPLAHHRHTTAHARTQPLLPTLRATHLGHPTLRLTQPRVRRLSLHEVLVLHVVRGHLRSLIRSLIGSP